MSKIPTTQITQSTSVSRRTNPFLSEQRDSHAPDVQSRTGIPTEMPIALPTEQPTNADRPTVREHIRNPYLPGAPEQFSKKASSSRARINPFITETATAAEISSEKPLVKSARASKRNTLNAILTGALLITGICVMSYPTLAQYQNQLFQAQVNQELSSTQQALGDHWLAEAKEKAILYNQAIAAGTKPEFVYKDLLKLPQPDAIGRLRIPSIDLDQAIRHGDGEDSLRRGLGHTEGTSLPVGGTSTHAVISGHRGLAEIAGFTHLPEVQRGDLVYVETLGEILTYKILRTEVVSPEKANMRPIIPGEDLLTLITCTPLGINTDRFVATAERVETPASETVKVTPVRFPTELIFSAGAVIATAAWTSYRAFRKRSSKDERENSAAEHSN